MEKEQTVVFNNFQILYDYYDLNKGKKKSLTTGLGGGGGKPHTYTHKNSNQSRTHDLYAPH